MKNVGLIMGVLLLTVSLAACQEENELELHTKTTEPVVQQKEIKDPIETLEKPDTIDSSNGGIVAGGTDVSLSLLEKDKGEGIVTFKYSLKNQTPNVVTYHFNSGLQYDFSITNEQGEKVYQHSEEVMSTMALATKDVRQGESLTYEVETPKLEKGKYKIEVWTNVGSKHDFSKVSEFEVK